MRGRSLVLSCAVLSACASGEDGPSEYLADNMILAAVEADGTLAIVDGDTGALLETLDLSGSAHGEPVKYDVHNVQTDPAGRMVWLTAMPAMEGGDHGGMDDELIGVDLLELEVATRIELGPELHAAHVVVAGSTAYVTANEADAILVVDLEGEAVDRSIALPAGTGPHGARLTADGGTLVVAGMGDGSLHLLDTASDELRAWDLPGRAVQVAVLPDGSAAFATVFDTRQVARLDLDSDELVLFDLPAGSVGPVQIYAAPDGLSVWVADQGIVDGQPTGDTVVQLDAATGAVLQAVEVDPGPHGVVVNEDGSRVWVTTLVEGTVQSIDPATGEVLTTTPVGNEPNGITCRHVDGAMP